MLIIELHDKKAVEDVLELRKFKLQEFHREDIGVFLDTIENYEVTAGSNDTTIIIEKHDQELRAKLLACEFVKSVSPNLPSRERMLELAEAEDRCESISVGGLYCDLGLYKNPNTVAKQIAEQIVKNPQIIEDLRNTLMHEQAVDWLDVEDCSE